MMGLQRQRMSARTKMGAKWLQKVKKGQVAPKGLLYLDQLFITLKLFLNHRVSTEVSYFIANSDKLAYQ